MKTKEEIRKYKREYMRRWRKENPQKVKQSSKEYREKYPEKNKEYYRMNREKAIKYSKEWKRDNPEKVIENKKRWRQNNPNKVAEMKKRYYSKPIARENRNKYCREKRKELVFNSKAKIRAKTQYYFPLINKKCSCGNIAECHHHTTKPYQYDRFKFMCNGCHNELHKSGEIKW